MRELESRYNQLNNLLEQITVNWPDNNAIWLFDNRYKIFDVAEKVFDELNTHRLQGLFKVNLLTKDGYPRVAAASKELIHQSEEAGLEGDELRKLIIKISRERAFTYQEVEVLDLFLNLESLLLVNICLGAMLDQTRQIYRAQLVAEKALRWQSRGRSQALPAKWVEKNIKGLENLGQAFFFSRLPEFGLHAEGSHKVEGILEAYEGEKQKINSKLSTAIRVLHVTTQINWEKIYEQVLPSAEELRNDPSEHYDQQTISSRLQYLKQVGIMALRTNRSEKEVALEAVAKSKQASTEEEKHVGFHLFPDEKPESWPFITLLFFSSFLFTLALIDYFWQGWGKVLIGILLFFPVYSAVTTITMSLFARWQKKRFLGQLDFHKEVPAEHSTFVAVPCILLNETVLRALVLDLETMYAGNPQKNIYFALLLGLPDSKREHEPEDNTLAQLARTLISDLNKKYWKTDSEKRFFVLIRKRLWNEKEGVFMEWERKRGKLMEFNALLTKPDTPTSFLPDESMHSLPQIRYVITLDEKTKLPIGGAAKLIGTMAHPLNRPRFDQAGRKYRGFGIIQPRIIDTLESVNVSLFSRLFAGSPGLDIYSLDRSDLYFDTFKSGVFWGKGIYDIKTIQLAHQNLPDNRILSHDHLEGSLSGTAFASNICLTEDFPSNYRSEYRRQHRWVRGDWQVIGLLLNYKLPLFEKWKLIDNVLRSLVPPASLAAALIAAFNYNLPLVLIIIALVLALDIKNVFISLRPPKKYNTVFYYLFNHLKKTFHIILIMVAKIIFWLDTSWRNIDAILRTWWRLLISHKNLLQWQTAYVTEQNSKKTLLESYRGSIGSTVGALIMIGATFSWLAPWWLFGLSLLWFFAPGLGWILSHKTEKKTHLSEDQKNYLRPLLQEQINFFLNYSAKSNNYLIPDFIQFSDDTQRVATETSATNIGFLLLALVAARENDSLTTVEFLKRTEQSIETIITLNRYEGHLYNWYDTRNGDIAGSQYVSSVDSANFTVGLIVLKQYLKELDDQNSDRHLDALYTKLIGQCEDILNSTNFSIFLDEDRGLFRIGLNAKTGEIDDLFYDLLISEANMISYLATAFQQVNPDQWFRHSRNIVRGNFDQPVLASWSGSLFEYLTSLLFLPAPKGSVLYQSGISAIDIHKDYAKKYRIPWGMGESAFNLIGIDGRYQYRTFGAPPLAMRWDVKEHLVVSPYSSLLALNFAPESVIENLRVLEGSGMKNQFGFYDAIDYTTNQNGQVVKVIYAHHQGFSLVSILNALFDDKIKNLFLSDPRMKAAGTLLEELAPTTPAKKDQGKVTVTSENLQNEIVTTRQVLADREIMRRLPYRYLTNRQSFVSNIGNRGGWLGWRKYLLTKRPDLSDLTPNDYQILFSLNGGPIVPLAKAEDSQNIPGGLNRNVKIGDLLVNLDIILPEQSAGEIRQLTLENKGKTKMEVQFGSLYQPALLPIIDHSNPRYQDMLLRTKWLKSQNILLHERRFPNMSGTLYLAHKIVSTNQEITPVPLIGNRDMENTDSLFDAYKKAPLITDPVYPYGGLAAKRLLEPGEKYQINWLTAAGTSITEVNLNFDSLENHLTKHEDYLIEKINPYQQEVFEILGNGLQCGGFVHTRPPLPATSQPFIDSLWRHGLDGRYYLIVFKIDTPSQLVILEHLLAAQQFLEHRHVITDIGIINTHSESYKNELDVEIESMLNFYHLKYPDLITRTVHLRSRLLPEWEINAFYQSADAVFDAGQGYIEEQIQRQVRIPKLDAPSTPTTVWRTEPEYKLNHDTGEFSFSLPANHHPGKPWTQLLTSDALGTLIDDHGKSFSWYKNSQDMRITKWDSDPNNFTGGEWFELSDRDTGESHLLTHGEENKITYGQGTARYETELPKIAASTEIIVSRDHPEKLVKIELENLGEKSLNVDVKAFAHFVLGHKTGQHLRARLLNPNTIEITNPFNHHFLETIQLELTGSAISVKPILTDQWTDLANWPLEIISSTTLLPKQKTQILARLSVLSETKEALTLKHFLATKAAVVNFWQEQKSVVEINTPDKNLNFLFNHWLVYQTRASRLEGRLSFWQPSGAFGFRDQLQDIMVFSIVDPEKARSFILYAAARQFNTGNVLNWWQPESDFGLGRAFTDHQLWLVKATLFYVARTGDESIWKEVVEFKEDPGINFRTKPSWTGIPAPARDADTLYGHCVRALDFSLQFGSHDLPLLGQSDWNDGLGEVGNQGQGESVWTGFFLSQLLTEFSDICLEHNDRNRAEYYKNQAAKINHAIETHCWDGKYYIRAFRDNGEVLGSNFNEEFKIDSIVQSWSVLRDGTVSDRANQALESAMEYLVDTEIKLLTPPVTGKLNRVGHLDDYPAGIRENGSQYNHGALWFVQALAISGRNREVYDLLKLISPIHRAEKNLAQYRGEPYVVAAEIYANPAMAGESGWTWYTAAAGVMYLTILESMFGIKINRLKEFSVKPVLPDTWSECSVKIKMGTTVYEFSFEKSSEPDKTRTEVIEQDGKTHLVKIKF